MTPLDHADPMSPAAATRRATADHTLAAGGLVRLELTQPPEDEITEVEMTRERYAADPLHVGDSVFVKPRQLRVFLDDSKPAPPIHWSGDGDGI
mgnify:CR=1 FL=1